MLIGPKGRIFIGIRVNALCPGWVDTPFTSPFVAQMGGRAAIEAYVREKVPMG